MPSGGARAGAGRPRKATKYGGQIVAAEDRIADRLPDLIDRAFVLAMGEQVRVPVLDEVTGKPLTVPLFGDDGEPLLDLDGNAREEVVTQLVWSRLPDRKSIFLLVERILGKPPQEIIMSDEDGPIGINAAHRQEAAIEIEAWRAKMMPTLLSFPSAPPTTGTSSTPTAS